MYLRQDKTITSCIPLFLVHSWVLVLHHLEEEHAHHLCHGAAGGWVAGLAGGCHFDAMHSQLRGEIPQHISLLHGGLVVERVSHGEESETWGGRW